MAWGKAGSTTTTSSANSMDSGTMSASKTNQILCNVSGLSASTFCETVFNSDTGSNYANRGNQNGGTDFTRTSQSDLNMFESYGNTTGAFLVSYFVNISGEEKLGISQSIREGTSGVGNAPERDEVVYKWTNTSSQITSSTFTPQSGTINTDSNLTVLGSDMTPQINSPAVPAIPSLLPNLPSGSVGGWKEVGRTTLSGTSQNLSVSSLPDKRYYMVLSNCIRTVSGTQYIQPDFQFNGDTSTNYSSRWSVNGASEGTLVNYNRVHQGATTDEGAMFQVSNIANLAGKEKLVIGHEGQPRLAGAGTAPTRVEWVGKWANTSDAIHTINTWESGTGSYASGSETVILGWDPSDTHTTNFWEELTDKSWTSGNAITTDTFTTKKYLWIQGWYTQSGTSGHNRFRVGNGTIDTGSNYSHNYSINGGTNATGTSLDNLWSVVGQGSDAGIDRCFFNMFVINDASDNKFITGHNVWSQTDGAGTAPERTEYACKWANTSDQINIVEININGSGSFSGGQIKVWGSD